MPTNQKKADFFTSEEGLIAQKVLEAMVEDDAYKTDPTYSPNSVLYPDSSVPFVVKHMCFLRDHPNTDPRHYISNLRLVTKLK